jgi:signal transduction histidine kinase/CheY-like chemotaxis protein
MILIVDDHAENIFSLKKLLEINNFSVDTASSGEEALKKILKNSFSLIILDVQMPVMDGFEVAEAISGYSKSKDIPIIFLSAVNTDKRFITKGYAKGGIDYITKPFDPDILLLKVKTFYTLSEQRRELEAMQQTLRNEIDYRTRAQSELKEKVKELRSILESIPQIAFTAKNDGTIEFVNDKWFKYSSLQNSFPETHPKDKDLLKSWQEAIKTGKILDAEVRLKEPQKSSYRHHLLRAIPVKENDIIVKWVGTFTDIEEQKRIELKKDEFMSIASHELKTPLTSIKGYVQILAKSLAKSNNILAINYLNRTKIQVEKLNLLIADLLDISKIENGKLEFNKKAFDLDPMLTSAIDIIQQTHECTIIKKNTLDIIVFGDEIRIEQVIINYLTNAIKYSPDCKEVHVETSYSDDKKFIVIRVKDFGIGIPEKMHVHIFKKFYRVEESSNHFQGLGIGLFICSEIIKRHGGQYGVNSEPGKGAEFYFTIPINEQN